MPHGGACAGGDVVQVDVQGVGLDPHVEETARELMRRAASGWLPCGDPAARPRPVEGAGADRDNAGAAPVGLLDRIDHGGRGGLLAALPTGDYHRVRRVECREIVAHEHVVSRQGRHGSWMLGAHRELVTCRQARAAHAEDLGRARQLERGLRRQNQRGNPMNTHGRKVPAGVNPDTGPERMFAATMGS